jgi:hypothetical protein
MLLHLKALIVVLTISTTVFVLAKPICLRFMAENDFARRRNVWFVLTVVAFASPSFWLFALVAVPILVWSTQKDTNPVALYLLLLHVISPSDGLDVSVMGIRQVFEINIYRILSFAVLIPAAWQLIRRGDRAIFRLTTVDVLILAWGGLQLVLLMPYESLTNTLRRGFLFSVDVLVLYFVVSRICTNRHAIVETMASFFLACAILAPLAAFESLWGWALYNEFNWIWGIPQNNTILLRAGTLRAQVSAGHSLALGYLMAIGFGFWLYLRSHVKSKPLTIAVTAWMWMGLLAAYARAPWLVAVSIFFAFLALVPKGSAQFFKALITAAFVAVAVLVSPIGARVIDNLPFVGTVNADTVLYRERLADASWELIQQNPFLGDPFFMLNLEHLRQGQGIIDLVNTYASTAMAHGLVGLFLFLTPFLLAMWNAYRSVKGSVGTTEVFVLGTIAYSFVRRPVDVDPDVLLLGVALVACMLGTLLMLATVSHILGIAVMYWLLTGLAAGYVQFVKSLQIPQARQY